MTTAATKTELYLILSDLSTINIFKRRLKTHVLYSKSVPLFGSLAWRDGLAELRVGLDQRRCFTSGPVSTGTGNRMQVGKPVCN